MPPLQPRILTRILKSLQNLAEIMAQADGVIAQTRVRSAHCSDQGSIELHHVG
jgi:hypothetical protein